MIHMGKIIEIKDTPVTTVEGLKLIRRETTVLMPNGRCRHPVVYFDATPGTLKVTKEERERRRIPVYSQII